MTKIEWTDRTWNPVTGCTKVSPGCDHCYAEGIARRFAGGPAFPNGFDVTLRPGKMEDPLRWQKPARVFVNSMSDLFHNDVPDSFIAQVFGTMAVASGPFSGPKSPMVSMGTFRMFPGEPKREAFLPAADYGPHTFQILTKRHGRMRSLLNRQDFRVEVSRAAYRAAHNRRTAGALADHIEYGPLWPLPNVWLGVSAEDQPRANLRIPALLDTPAAVRFVSAEPLIGSLNLDSAWAGLDWVIVGGESGPGARPMQLDWAASLVNDCRALGIAPFVKQLGSVHGPGKGGDMDAWPASLRVREWPEGVAA